MRIEETFQGESIELDGEEFIKCSFEECEIVYAGGEGPRIVNCSFSRCSWKFDAAAARTISFMRAMYHGMGGAGRQLIEDTFETIREPPPEE